MPASKTLTPTIYYAPKPKTRWTTWAKRIAARVFFPPVLLWDTAKWIANNLAGEALGLLVVQAQEIYKAPSTQNPTMTLGQQLKETSDQHLMSLNRTASTDQPLTAHKLTVITHDEEQLDTLELLHNAQSTLLPAEQKYIIKFPSAGGCYESSVIEMENDALDRQTHVVGFNPRGVCQSTGKPRSTTDLITDGIAQVQRLLDKGITPDNITLKGFSLGGSTEILVAHHFIKLGIRINVFADRPFSTLTNVVVGTIRHIPYGSDKRLWTGHSENVGKIILSWIAKPIIKFFLALTKWEINVTSAFKALPDSHKEYTVVRSSKADRKRHGTNLKDDVVIPHYASLHMGLKSERREQKTKIQYALCDIAALSTDALIQQELSATHRNLIAAKNHLNMRKLTPANIETDAHLQPLHSLTDRCYGKTGNEVFAAFWKRAHGHHAHQKNPQRDSVWTTYAPSRTRTMEMRSS